LEDLDPSDLNLILNDFLVIWWEIREITSAIVEPTLYSAKENVCQVRIHGETMALLAHIGQKFGTPLFTGRMGATEDVLKVFIGRLA
jgi:hypothetical protein